MTPIRTAARADQQQIWTVQGAVGPQEGTWNSNCLSLLRTSSRLIQTGWKWLERKRVQHVSSRRLRLTETISLGEKRSVSIIEVDGAQYLIGSSAGSVQLLTVLEKQDGRDSRRTEARAS